jgi:4-hydroxyacetophenone monooxygenase
MKDAAMSTVQVNQGDAWMEALDLALNDADIPTLLMVLIQLTGDTNWLSPRFQCLRVRGLTDDGTSPASCDLNGYSIV